MYLSFSRILTGLFLMVFSATFSQALVIGKNDNTVVSNPRKLSSRMVRYSSGYGGESSHKIDNIRYLRHHSPIRRTLEKKKREDLVIRQPPFRYIVKN
ncbi:hypothetical protein F4703DRAFT_1845201 [Phycomyces blakesleeanus]